MSQENDGTFECGRCRTALNSEDKNCWRCGSTDLRDMRPQPKLNDCDGFEVSASSAFADMAESIRKAWEKEGVIGSANANTDTF